jgi:hypothetical protein
MGSIDLLAQSEGVAVSIADHSLAGQFVDIGSYVFGWQGVKFDAVGAAAVLRSEGFANTLSSIGITPVGTADVISCNVNGVGVMGGGIVGSIGGQDIEGTTFCRIELPSSTSSGILNCLFTLAGGPVGWAVSRIVLGALQHDMEGINQAARLNNLTVNDAQPQVYAAFQPYGYSDENGNVLRTLEGEDVQPLLDAYGKPKLEIVMESADAGVGRTIIEFDSRGRVLSTRNDLTPAELARFA